MTPKKSQTQFIQQNILEIFKDFLLFCEEHNISYGLCGGTLLGAVRHSGFIPWDDDLDVYISRADAEKLINNWKSEKYTLISYKDKKYYKKHTHIKIFDNRYRLLELGDEECGYPELTNYGVFMDLFIFDEYKNNFVERMIHRHYGRLLFAKERQLYSRQVSKTGKAVQLVRFIPGSIIDWLSNYLKKVYSSRTDGEYIGFGFDTHCNNFFLPKNKFLPFVEYEFCGIKVKGPRDYDFYLQQRFGDYMIIPPEGSRHNHIQSIYKKIDFESERDHARN